MRLFHLIRDEDESGVSGTGLVAEGAEFADGTCVISWRTGYSSLGIYPDAEELEKVHGHGGKTRIEWLPELFSI